MSNLTLHRMAAAARGRRRELGLSQDGLARRLGVSRRWIRDFETGSGGANIETVLALFDVLDMPLTLERPSTSEMQVDDVDLDAVLDAHRG